VEHSSSQERDQLESKLVPSSLKKQQQQQLLPRQHLPQKFQRKKRDNPFILAGRLYSF
jgi:hypothetical protein